MAAQQRGLARAVGADDGDDLALAHRQVDLVHGLDLAVGDAELLQIEQRGLTLAHRPPRVAAQVGFEHARLACTSAGVPSAITRRTPAP
jgi:hypothetical protein